MGHEKRDSGGSAVLRRPYCHVARILVASHLSSMRSLHNIGCLRARDSGRALCSRKRWPTVRHSRPEDRHVVTSVVTPSPTRRRRRCDGAGPAPVVRWSRHLIHRLRRCNQPPRSNRTDVRGVEGVRDVGFLLPLDSSEKKNRTTPARARSRACILTAVAPVGAECLPWAGRVGHRPHARSVEAMWML